MNSFGMERVLEPVGSVPVSAWKIDNSRTIKDDEMRVSISIVHLEWDNFHQVCSSCGYEANRIKAKLMDMIDKRGKLHNPFTRSGGNVYGTVEEIGKDYSNQYGLKVGDMVICNASTTAIPMFIEEITSIDYNYGQIDCKGYAIFFSDTPLIQVSSDVNHRHIMTAMNEGGSIFSIYHMIKDTNSRRVTLIAKDMITALLYAAGIREPSNPRCEISVILDRFMFNQASEKEIVSILTSLVDKVFFFDLSNPIEAFRLLKKYNKNEIAEDIVIVSEDIRGAESLGVLACKPGGQLYCTTVKNNYDAAVLFSESIGKTLYTYAFDQYRVDYQPFVLELVNKCEALLGEVDKLYSKGNNNAAQYQKRNNISATAMKGNIDDFVFQSVITKALVEDVINIAQYDCNVIIQGETGVGKEKVLSLIHQNSTRKGQPCIRINCATIQESLAESEFFGYEKGSFTGAQSTGKDGYFAMANNGILFLDEIGALSLNMQSKLLRVLQENQYYKVGGTEQLSVNVRVVCANNVSLKKLVEEGKFREDLYYRLNICTIEVPPLRERRDDIFALSERFLSNYNKKYGVEKELTQEAVGKLYSYHWPGNVRELENIVHRLVINTKGAIIDAESVEEILNNNAYEDIIINVRKSFSREESVDYNKLMEEQEKRIIEYALKKEGTTRKAAEYLNMPQTTLARKKVKFGL